MYTRYLKVRGDAFSRGVKIGKELQSAIRTNYVNQKRHYESTRAYDFAKWADICLKYVPIMEKYAPETLAEVKGMACGADVDLKYVLAIATANEKSFNCDEISDKCTSFSAYGAATKDGLMICGQTNDERMDEFPPELDLTIHHIDNNGLEMLIYTHPGIPAYMGCNNKGIVLLWTYINNGLKQEGVPTCAIIRETLSKETYEEAVNYVKSIPHAVPNYFKLCHREKGATGLECFPNKVYEKVYGDISAHTNHNLLCVGFEPECSDSLSSKLRLKNMLRLLEENYGRIDVEVAKNFLRDHTDFPYSICKHPNESRPMTKTLAGQVYDLSHGKMYIAHGNPCENPYHEYEFEHYKP